MRTMGWSLSTDQMALRIAGYQQRRIAIGADDQRLHIVDPRPLRGRGVESVRIVHRQRSLLHVADHADDDMPGTISVTHIRAHPHALADGVSMGKQALSKRIADQHRSGRSGFVVLGKQTAAQQRDAHGGKIFGRDLVTIGPDSLLAGIRLELQAVAFEVATQWQLAGEGRILNAGNFADSLQRPLIEASPRRVERWLVRFGDGAAVVVLHLHAEQMRGMKSRRHREQPLNTAQQQARAHQQHQGNRHLGDD